MGMGAAEFAEYVGDIWVEAIAGNANDRITLLRLASVGGCVVVIVILLFGLFF